MLTITEDDCKHIIIKTNFKDCTYSDHELTPFTEGRTGRLGEHYKLKIKFNDTPEEEKLFVKRIPSKYCTNRKEEGFYGRIVPEFLKHEIKEIKSITPQCYYIKSFDYIVLEDLTTQGFKTLSPRGPLDINYVLCALESLATYHGASIIYEIKKSKELNGKFDMRQYFTEELQEIYYREHPVEKDVLQATRNTIESQVSIFENCVCRNLDKEKLVLRLTSLWDSMKDYVKPSTEYKNVVCHGDLWQANLMFSIKNDLPEKCIFIDEQMIRYCPPALDVMSFLYQTTDRNLREKHSSTLLESYYNFLQEVLYQYDNDCETLISREEFLRSCETYKPFAMLQAFSYAHVTQIPTELFENFMGQEDEKKQFLFETRAPGLEKFCREDGVYKETQLECLLDLVEFVEIQETQM